MSITISPSHPFGKHSGYNFHTFEIELFKIPELTWQIPIIEGTVKSPEFKYSFYQFGYKSANADWMELEIKPDVQNE